MTPNCRRKGSDPEGIQGDDRDRALRLEPAAIDPGVQEARREVPRPELCPRVQGSHEMDWVRACKSGTRAGAHFSYSGPLTEICLLGNVAKRVQTRILWDAETLKVTNLPEANK